MIMRRFDHVIVLTVIVAATIFAVSVQGSAQETSAVLSGGSVQIGYDSTVCSGAIEGAVRYNSSQGVEFCDGSDWRSAGTCSSQDISPNAFDFPDSPTLGGASHTWSALQITGFDLATVTISGYAMEFRVCADAACTNILKNWRSVSATMAGGEYLQIRTTLPAYTTATVTVGDASDNLTVNGPYLVFATSTTHNGNIGGVSAADTICQTRANAEILPGTYRAWITSSSTDEPVDRFENVSTTRAFYRLDGVKVVDDWADLVDGGLDNAISVDETGAAATGFVWTNTTPSGSVNGTNDCSNWTSTGPSGVRGDVTDTSNWWTQHSTNSCSNARHLYCFQTAQ